MLERVNDGGPAFPCDEIIRRDEKGSLHGPEISSTGMSMRDHFAGLAMHALIAEPFVAGCDATVMQFSAGANVKPGPERYAFAAYKMADAMLRERQFPPSGGGDSNGR